jgi:hypothetical protein
MGAPELYLMTSCAPVVQIDLDTEGRKEGVHSMRESALCRAEQ